jgi:hypothetical protein
MQTETAQNDTNNSPFAQWKPKVVGVSLPSGVTVKARRPQLSLWISQGRLPERLFIDALRVAANGGPKTLDGDELADLMKFALALAKECMVSPRVVDEADPEKDDEVSAGDIPAGDLIRFAMWAVSGAGVSTTTGEVSADALASFREDDGVSGAGADGRAVQPAA